MLKDWKKIGKDYWINKSRHAIKIGKTRVPISAFGTGDRVEYNVSIGYIAGNFVEDYSNYFKTKSQALKFAKSYMRTH